jgi:hypothetical protein
VIREQVKEMQTEIDAMKQALVVIEDSSLRLHRSGRGVHFGYVPKGGVEQSTSDLARVDALSRRQYLESQIALLQSLVLRLSKALDAAELGKKMDRCNTRLRRFEEAGIDLRKVLFTKEQNEWIVVGRPLEEAAKVTLDYKAPLAAGIMVLMIMAMVFDFIPVEPVTAVMIAALLMVVTGCFRNVEAAYKTINWESIVLIAAMMPMSTALEKTGVSEYISNTLVSGLGSFGPIALMAGIYFTTSLMTMFISNTATAVLLAPIAMSSAVAIGVSPVPFLVAVAVAASMCFASPFSTPPNALVMPAGQYTFMDYVKVGLPLQIIMAIVMILVLPLLFPF